MLQNVYCVASPVREHGSLHELITDVRKELRAHAIPFQSPKMGDHITFISPFRATESEIQWLVAGLSFCRAFHDAETPRCIAFSEKPHFFRNKEGDALVLKISVNNQLKNAVEQWRSKLQDTNEWVYSPESYFFNAHTTIGEGVGLFDQVESLKGKLKAFKGMTTNRIVIPIDNPIVWQKMPNRRWKPVHF